MHATMAISPLLIKDVSSLEAYYYTQAGLCNFIQQHALFATCTKTMAFLSQNFLLCFLFFFILGSFFLRQIYSCANRLVHHTIQQCGFVHLTTIQKQEVHTTSNSTQTHILSFTQLRNKVTSSAEPTVILIALQ